MILFFNIETNGVPVNINASPLERNLWPDIIHLSYFSIDSKLNIKGVYNEKISGFQVPKADFYINNGYSSDQEGSPIFEALEALIDEMNNSEKIISHGMFQNSRILAAEMHNLGLKAEKKEKLCSREMAAEILGHDGYFSTKNIAKMMFDEDVDYLDPHGKNFFAKRIYEKYLKFSNK